MPDQSNAPPARLRALIYNRVSADPSGSRVSVNSQDVENRAFAERQGWEIVGTIFDNDRSATRYATRIREGYQQVLHAITGRSELGRIDVLVTWEASRAERNMDSYPELRRLLADYGVLHAYKGRVHDLRLSDDRFTHGLDVLLAEREGEIARERTLRSHRDSARRGAPRGVTPYGYQRAYDLHSGRLVAQTPHPETAAIVQEIGRRILGGDTLYSIAQDLNRRGVLTPAAHRDAEAGREPAQERNGWTSSIIRNILRKQSLMGIRTHHGVAQGEATWPAIIPPDDWAEIQRFLADPGRVRHSAGVAVQHLLSGIAECGVCGGWLRPLRNKGRMSYRCEGTNHTGTRGHVSRSQLDLDDYVTVAVVQRASRDDFLQRLRAKAAEPVPAQHDIERRIAGERAKLTQYEAAAEEADGDELGTYLGLIKRTHARIRDLQEQAKPKGVPPALLDLAGPDAAQRWETASLERRRQIIRAAVRVIVYRSNVPRGAHTFDYSSVDLVWREY